MNLIKRLTRNRMARTGEKYMVARRAILEADPAEFARLKEEDRQILSRHRYPDTSRDGLDRRHVLSAWETDRRKH